MKKVSKIAMALCCFIFFSHGETSATEKINDIPGNSIPQHKYHSHENYSNETLLSDTLKFNKTTKKFTQTKERLPKKAIRSQSLTEPAYPSEDIFGWYSDNNRVNVKYADAKLIGKYGNGNLYVYVDPSLKSPQWSNAFDKGLAGRAKGQNGIKVLNNLIELKINADARLYTNKLYKNDQGNYIAILGNEARHKKIRRKNNKKAKIEIRGCDSTASISKKHKDFARAYQNSHPEL